MMKLSLIFPLAAAITTTTHAFFSGFNIGANLASGACRAESDWELAFDKIASFPGNFRNVRLFASSDCNALANAVPAAIKTGTKLLVGVWTEDDSHFDAEKQALMQAVQQHGKDWILAVSVGSEDLYRQEASPDVMAQKIYDVRGLLGSIGAGDKRVGHVDTWTAWVDPANQAVINAVDWLGNDAYAYWEGASIDNGAANGAYWAAMNQVRAVSQGKDVWLTETGWPVTGPPVGNAVPSVGALQTFWWQVACTSVKEMNFFWYDLDDFSASPQFAIVGSDYNPLIDMTCS